MKILLLTILGGTLAAQTTPVSPFVAGASETYRILKDVVYFVSGGQENKLDAYVHKDGVEKHPVVLYIHGGGWTGGFKEMSTMNLLPYFEAGWDVVNIDYRLARQALAPASVEDCRCALRWISQNAAEYKFDLSRVVVTGGSAGGHLALTTGMLTPTGGFDRQCEDGKPLPVAAIVNWYGITDVNDLMDGPNRRLFAVNWLGDLPDRERIARSVSPMNMLRKDLPPIITIHGDKDPAVPYEHGVRLHRALNELKVPNKLVTIPGGGHAGFPLQEMIRAHTEIRGFLDRYVIRR